MRKARGYREAAETRKNRVLGGKIHRRGMVAALRGALNAVAYLGRAPPESGQEASSYPILTLPIWNDRWQGNRVPVVKAYFNTHLRCLNSTNSSLFSTGCEPRVTRRPFSSHVVCIFHNIGAASKLTVRSKYWFDKWEDHHDHRESYDHTSPTNFPW